MITQEEKDKLTQYAELKSEIKILEKKAEELNPAVLEIMEEHKAEEITLYIGKLSLGSRRTWKYSAEITEMDQGLKNAKKEEEQLGVATYTEKKYVVFKTGKDD